MKPGWLTNELIESSIQKDRLMAKAKKSTDESVIKKAREKRNEVKTSIKNARSDLYINKLKKYSGNPTKFWTIVNELTKCKSTSHVTYVIDPSTGNLADCQMSANIINSYFTEKGCKLDLKLPAGTDPDTMFRVDTGFELKPDITVDSVVELISGIDISKSSGCHSISSKIYKDCLMVLREQLTFLFNLSIKTTCIPSAWKSRVVTPLPKKGDTTNPDNIRPITQTHICGKLLKKVISVRLTNYLEINDLFYPAQMGFRKGFSPSWRFRNWYLISMFA